MYARVMSCILFPAVPPTDEEVEMWKADDYKLLREWVERCGDKKSVSAAQHAAAVEFLESHDGKDALMAGLQARFQVLSVLPRVAMSWGRCLPLGDCNFCNVCDQVFNGHPFYDPAQFLTPQAFENWKVKEIDSVERQKNILVNFQKTELVVRCLTPQSLSPLQCVKGGGGCQWCSSARGASFECFFCVTLASEFFFHRDSGRRLCHIFLGRSGGGVIHGFTPLARARGGGGGEAGTRTCVTLWRLTQVARSAVSG